MSPLVFSQPALLWALPAAALPLIIHLINRHRARVRSFAAIDFLFRVQKRSARRILLRQVILLLLRTLIIALLVMAAAGPRIQSVTQENVPGSVSSALVLDVSFSMRARQDDRSRFEEAQQRARKYIQAMAPGDSGCLIVAGQKPLVAQTFSEASSLLLDALDAQQPSWGGGDLTAAMELAAAELSKAPGPNKKIRLFTDGARHAFGRPPVWPDGPPPQVVLDDVGLDEPRDNHAILKVDQSSNGVYLKLATRLISHSSDKVEDLPAWLSLDKRTVSRGFVDLEPGQPAGKLFTVQAPTSGDVLGMIHLEADKLPEDDRMPFLASGREEVQVLVVNGDLRPVLHRDELFYLEHALTPAGGRGNAIKFTSVTPDRFKGGLLNSAQVVILANVRQLNPGAYQSLSDFLAAGGGVLISMGDQIVVDSLNQELGQLLPRSLRDVVALGPAEPDGTFRQGLAFGEFRPDHPVLSLFASGGSRALSAVTTRRAVVLEPARAEDRDQVLIRYANGTPALVEGNHRGGKVILFTSSLDRDWTNWPARASFLPFLQQTVSYLAGRLDELPAPEIQVGQKIRVPIIGGANGVRIHPPADGRPQTRTAGQGTRFIEYSDSAVPGWYAVEQLSDARVLPGRSIAGFFVRLPPRESDLRAMDAEGLQALLGRGAQLSLAGTNGDEATSRTWLFILLVLGLCLCEAFIIRR